MKLKYFLLDVFTEDKLAGNPLAVVRGADHLSDAEMQRIAAEFNLSETVFVRQPRLDYHAASLRIFTPTAELPFAGHPTVGAAVLLGLEQRLAAVRLEEQVGLVTCVMEKTGRRSGTAFFSLPKMPERLGDAPTSADMAPSLGLTEEDFGCPPYVSGLFTAGVPYYLVPVRDAEVLTRLRVERRGWSDVFAVGHGAAYIFTATPGEKDNDFAARMFAPTLGFSEDPATGSAAAALIGLVSASEPENGSFEKILRQGREIGRPSRITLRFTRSNGGLERAGIGGSAVVLAEGELDLDP